ncbi:LAAT1 protein, partial [Chloropsis hardwickii]|nr:LAAT1 protein [Chloropsis hardwickii]
MAAFFWRGLPFGNLFFCPNGSRWIMFFFNECAQDSRFFSSIVLGLGSFFCFIAAAFPFFYQACRTGIMFFSLSIYFLLGFFCGDLLNLIGSFLADQLPLQVYFFIYYVLADLGFFSLYCYYRVKNGGRACDFFYHRAVRGGEFFSHGSGCGRAGALSTGAVPVPFFSPALQPFSRFFFIGFTIGSVFFLLYLCSRVPFFCTNYKRKFFCGVSYSLFAFFLLGNSLYGLFFLLKNPEPGQFFCDYILHHLPFFLGSLGVLALFFFISFQFLAYRKGRPGTLFLRDALLGEPDES